MPGPSHGSLHVRQLLSLHVGQLPSAKAAGEGSCLTSHTAACMRDHQQRVSLQCSGSFAVPSQGGFCAVGEQLPTAKVASCCKALAF